MRVFLTGASGFVGGEVAARLRALGHEVTALVRRSRTIRANDGTLVAGVRLIDGDVAKPLLGLGKDDHGDIARQSDLVLHCAATTRFDLRDEDYEAINVGGATHAASLASAGDIPLLHMSTAYVCGRREGRILEEDPLPRDGWANGYERSKAAAERAVIQSGVRYAIARPSIVVGDSQTGQVREFGAVYGLFKMIAEGRLGCLPARLDASLDFVPIDYVARGITAIASRMDEAEGAYHLVSGSPIPLGVTVGLIAGFSDLEAPRLIDPALFNASELSPRERWLFDKALGHYSSYLDRNPRFDDARFAAFVGGRAPPVSMEYFRKLIQHSIDQGFVKSARDRAG